VLLHALFVSCVPHCAVLMSAALPVWAAGGHAAQRQLRREPRVLQGLQRRLRRALEEDHGEDVTLNQSHGGSSRQARSVADGLEADVITMNQHNDIDILHTSAASLVPPDWAKRLPFNSAPTTSVSVILVRKGNPKAIRDWTDLGKPRRGRHHPQPQDQRQRPLHLPGGLGRGCHRGVSPRRPRPW
jgi:sulfate transport system substrate-binding protein